MGPRVTFDENKKLRDREYLLLSLLPVPAVRTNTTCKTKKNQQTNLSFFLFLSISLSLLQLDCYSWIVTAGLLLQGGGVGHLCEPLESVRS
jgi:hypothetical protein